MEPKQKMMKNELSMTSGAPFRAILTFATPLVLGYILQQLYLIIDAVIIRSLAHSSALDCTLLTGQIVCVAPC